MKQILLLRHAKSSWNNPELKDYDRPLAERGRNDAPRVGEFLKKSGGIPRAVISSPARRAGETAGLVMTAAGLDKNTIIWREELYYGSHTDYLRAIQTAPDDFLRVMLVGHNPHIEDAAGIMCGNGTLRMSTAAMVCFEHPADKWEQVNASLTRLRWMVTPKLLKFL